MAVSRLERTVKAADPTKDWSKQLEALAERGIHTEADLVFAELDDEDADTQKLKSVVAKFVASPGRTAAQLCREQSARERQSLTTGVTRLDALIDGGLKAGEVVELSGPKGAGKTLMALHIVLRLLASDPTARALFVDVGGSFDPGRALDVLQSLSPPHRRAAADDIASQDRRVFDRLVVSKCFDLQAAVQAINQGVSADPMPSIVVVDCITDLFEGQIATSPKQGNAAMVWFVRRLSTWARSSPSPLTFLLVNSSVPVGSNPLSAFAATSHAPALGPTFAHLTDLTLWLNPAKDLFAEPQAQTSSTGRRIVAEVMRSRRALSTTWCTFLIMPNGSSITAD